MKMEIGLDKLTLTTTDFKVLNWGDKLWKPDQRQGEGKNQYQPVPEDLLLIDREGDACYHKKIYFNPTPDQKFGSSNVNITIGQKGLVMVWNPSKFERDPRTHIHPVDDHHILTERMEHTLNWVQKHLVDFDEKELNIHRLDMCRNIRTESPVSAYPKRLSGVLDMSRCNSSTYPTGMATGNKSRRFILYDKVRELTTDKEHKADKTFQSDMVTNWGDNLMRAEIQMLNSESVHRYWKIKKLGHIHQVGLPTLQDQYKSFMKERLFKVRTFESGSIPFPDGVQLIKGFQNQRDWFYKLVALCSGLDGIEQTYGSLDMFLMSVKQAMDDRAEPTIRKQMSRLKQNINKLVKQQASLQLNTNGVSQMYDELCRKICA
jgi:hypothetical protein